MNADLVARLRAALGDDQVITDAQTLAPFLVDQRERYQGHALCLAKPANSEEVAQVVMLAQAAGCAITPQGGNTGLCGGATPMQGEVLLSLSRMQRIRELDTANDCITVEAGAFLQAVQTAAATAQRLFPLSIASEGSATIGGCLSTNAGGIQVLRYGSMRSLTLGLEVVLPDGTLWNGLRSLRKDNTGYDLKQLFIGAEGTLGIITAAVLRLVPALRRHVSAWLAVAHPQAAIDLLHALRARLGERILAFELANSLTLHLVCQHHADARPALPLTADGWQVYLEVADEQAGTPAALREEVQEALAAAWQDNLLSDAVIAQSGREAAAFRALRENASEAQRREGLSQKHDISLPLSRLPEFITRAHALLTAACPGIRIVCFGHLGDGNLHYNLFLPSAVTQPALSIQVHDLVHCLGGSMSAEHGIGQLKRDDLRRYKSPLEMALMRQIKTSLDPRGLMNPGKIFNTVVSCG